MRAIDDAARGRRLPPDQDDGRAHSRCRQQPLNPEPIYNVVEVPRRLPQIQLDHATRFFTGISGTQPQPDSVISRRPNFGAPSRQDSQTKNPTENRRRKTLPASVPLTRSLKSKNSLGFADKPRANTEILATAICLFRSGMRSRVSALGWCRPTRRKLITLRSHGVTLGVISQIPVSVPVKSVDCETDSSGLSNLLTIQFAFSRTFASLAAGGTASCPTPAGTGRNRLRTRLLTCWSLVKWPKCRKPEHRSHGSNDMWSVVRVSDIFGTPGQNGIFAVDILEVNSTFVVRARSEL